MRKDSGFARGSVCGGLVKDGGDEAGEEGRVAGNTDSAKEGRVEQAQVVGARSLLLH